jgi:pentatricopeptide repeat protein
MKSSEHTCAIADLSTSKKPIELERRLRIRPGTSPYDASVHLNNYIRNSRNPKSHGSNEAAGAEYLETAEEILKTAPKESVNVAVWNVLLSGFAKERKYQRMFKAFNDVSGALDSVGLLEN